MPVLHQIGEKYVASLCSLRSIKEVEHLLKISDSDLRTFLKYIDPMYHQIQEF